jgi:pimeloyl-ACP methyl ester carboxylesterase
MNPWANEQNYQSVKKVYTFLGAPENVNIFARLGEHPVSARDLERCLDYLDLKFGRKNIPWEKTEFFNYTFDNWEKAHQSEKAEAATIKPVDLESSFSDLNSYQERKKKILANMQWLLGKEPSGVKATNIAPIRGDDWMDAITGRPVVKGAAAINLGPYSAMGDHLRGILYVPVDESGNKRLMSNGKMPVVSFLHQYAYGQGFAKGYNNRGGRRNEALFKSMTDKGFAVLAYDMIGFGTRLEEGTWYYQRFPQWSKMGTMVSDVKSCIDALESFDYIDSNHICLLGNTIGGAVALMAAAKDERISGVAVVSAVTPWRSSNSRYESLKTYSHQHGFIPKLGLFANHPENAPVDFKEIISCIAPRPLMVIAPTLDRYADPEAVNNTMKSVEKIYHLFKKEKNLVYERPLEINRMNEAMNSEIADFFSRIYDK